MVQAARWIAQLMVCACKLPFLDVFIFNGPGPVSELLAYRTPSPLILSVGLVLVSARIAPVICIRIRSTIICEFFGRLGVIFHTGICFGIFKFRGRSSIIVVCTGVLSIIIVILVGRSSLVLLCSSFIFVPSGILSELVIELTGRSGVVLLLCTGIINSKFILVRCWILELIVCTRVFQLVVRCAFLVKSLGIIFNA